MKKLRQTPSQTVGPFFAYSLTAEQYGYPFNSIINDSLIESNIDPQNCVTAGERIYITGQVLDGKGDSILDAVVELFQADANGQYRTTPIKHKNDGFTGFGRLGTGTNPEHRFTFTTIKPGSVNGQAPHIDVLLMMRGSLRNLYTRLYFSDNMAANEQDDLFKAVPENRRKTLIANRLEVNGLVFYEFNIRMQGEEETVFFEE
jgi:protocatechuate 3,4-dioxygenase, alpha subunit